MLPCLTMSQELLELLAQTERRLAKAFEHRLATVEALVAVLVVAKDDCKKDVLTEKVCVCGVCVWVREGVEAQVCGCAGVGLAWLACAKWPV